MAVLIEDRDFPLLVKAAGVALERGQTLLRWWNAFPPVELIELPGSREGCRMQYFFSELPIGGKPTTVMGCVQRSTFVRRASGSLPPASLSRWVSENFLQKCRWISPDGTPGGFHYRPAMVLDRGETAPRRVDEDLPLTLAEIGPRYQWAVVRLDLKDYMRSFPVVGKFHRWVQFMNREAGYLLFHPDFFSSPYPRPDGWVDEYCFGYSVVPWQVMPTPAAYGAGRFHSAYKDYRFYLLEDGSVAIDVLFLVAPRCERVLNMAGFDPVLGTVRLIDALTLGRTSIRERAHYAVNHYAIGHHGRVHHNLLNGMRRIWEETNWQPQRQAHAASR
ncbi:MAG: hypothetical protein R2729_09485 [Bryobacteraceae bacterium]